MTVGDSVHFTSSVLLPVTIEEAFAFTSDPVNWPTFVPACRSVHVLGWAVSGGRARITSRFLGRTLTSEVELTAWEPPTGFSYTLRTPGAPTLRNIRTFASHEGGTRVTATTEATPRPRAAGMADRVRLLAFRLMVRRAGRRLAAVVPDGRTG